MFCAEALFVIFTLQYGAGKEKECKCKGRPKNFQPFGLQRIWFPAQLHPKIFEKFSSHSVGGALAA